MINNITSTLAGSSLEAHSPSFSTGDEAQPTMTTPHARGNVSRRVCPVWSMALQEENSSQLWPKAQHFQECQACGFHSGFHLKNKNPTWGSTFPTLAPPEHAGWMSADFPAAIEGFWLNPRVCNKQQNNLVCYQEGRHGLIKTEKEINYIDSWRSVSL